MDSLPIPRAVRRGGFSIKFYLFRVIPTEPIKASGGISPAQIERGRGVKTPNIYARKCYFAPLERNVFA